MKVYTTVEQEVSDKYTEEQIQEWHSWHTTGGVAPDDNPLIEDDVEFVDKISWENIVETNIESK